MNTQNTNTKTKKDRIKLFRQHLKTGNLKNKSENKTALTSELSLIFNDRHSEKSIYAYFSVMMKHC